MRPFTAVLLVCSALATACTGESTESLLSSAKQSLAKNENSAAIIQLRNAIQKDPASAEARLLFGKVLLQSGNPVGAMVEFRKALELKHADDEVLPLLARALLAQQLWTEVTDELGATTLGNATAMADLKTSVATAFAARDMMPQAEAALQAALQANPDHAAAQVLQVRMLARQRDLPGSLALMAKVLEQHPQDSSAWKVNADLLLYGKGDLSGAFDSFRKAIAFDKLNIEAHAGAIAILMARADESSINKQLDELRAIAPNHPQTRYFDAQMAFKRRDFKRANLLLQELLRIVPDDVRALQLAGATELEIGALAQAETHLLKALQLASDQPMSRQLLAQAYLQSGQAGKAIDVLKPALERNPDSVTLSLAAQAYLYGGDAKRAELLFARAAKLDPHDMRSRTALALSSIGRGKHSAGFAELEALAASDKGTTAGLALISAHLARREYAAALQAAAALENKVPNKAFGANLRGRVQVMAGDTNGARQSFERALSIDPGYFPAASSLAALDLADKKPDAARQRYDALLRTDPKNVQALIALADLSARAAGNKDEIVALLEKAVSADPTAPTPRLILVEHYLRMKEPRLALNVAQSGVTAVPNNPAMIDALGRAQLASGEANQAITTFNGLAAVTPQSAQPHLRQAEAHLGARQPDAARQSLKRALAIAPDLLAAQQQLVLLELAEGRPNEALTVARQVQKQRPKESIGFELEGDVQGARKDSAAAATAYRTALRMAPAPQTAIKLHITLLSSGKSGEADRFASDWLRSHPRDAAYLLHLGNVALGHREFATAEARYHKVLELTPANPLALSNMAWAMALQDKRGAVAYAEKASKMRPNQPGAMGALAFALASEGQFDRAIEIQKALVQTQPRLALFRLNLARIYIKAGKRALAIAELDELAKLGDQGVSQVEVARLLKSLKEG